MDQTCITCEIVVEYVSLANQFTQNLSEVLLLPMWAIFLAMAGLWIVVHGIKMSVGQGDLGGLAKEFIFVVFAAALMAGQGPGLVNQVYSTALSVMGGATSMVLAAGSLGGDLGLETGGGGIPGYGGIENADGMRDLVFTAEHGVYKVFEMSGEIAAQWSMTNPMPILYAILLLLPYALLLIVYFAQVVVSIFRVMMFAALSPILMLGFGFGWGRGMAVTGLRTLFAAFMVLFGATVALAVCLYGVASLDVANAAETGNIRDILSIDNPKLIVAIALGWLGTAFLAEATGMANSIAGSQLTNQAAAVITAGAVATGLALIRPKQHKRALEAFQHYGKGLAGFGKGVGDASSQMSAAGKAIYERMKRTTFDRGE